MANYRVARIGEMESIYGGLFVRARAELGVESFGMQVLDLPPNLDQYPEHDHSQDGQEEVYLPLRGGGEIEIEGERFALDTETMARVGPGTKRKLWPGADGMRVLVIGGIPGRVYQSPPVSRLGEPDPSAS